MITDNNGAEPIRPSQTQPRPPRSAVDPSQHMRMPTLAESRAAQVRAEIVEANATGDAQIRISPQARPHRPNSPQKPSSTGAVTEPNTRAERQTRTPEQCQHEARIIGEMGAAAVLMSLAGKNFGSTVGGGGFKTYWDNLLAASGNPKDPIEVMLLEQLAWCHQRLGALHCQAAEARTVEVAVAYDAAAARLMAEYRKSALALRVYRSPLIPRQVTVVKQQNLAAGDQQIALVDGGTHNEALPEKTSNIELGSNQGLLHHVERTNTFATADRGAPEFVEAKRLNGRRPPAAS